MTLLPVSFDSLRLHKLALLILRTQFVARGQIYLRALHLDLGGTLLAYIYFAGFNCPTTLNRQAVILVLHLRFIASLMKRSFSD